MNERTAFQLVHGLTLHFKSLDYSLLKYGSNTAAAKKAFDVITGAQKARYVWLADKFPKTQDLVYCVIGNILKNQDVRFENSEQIKDAYYEFKSRRESLTYRIKSDISTESCYGNHSIISVLNRYFGNKLSPEYVILKFYETGELTKAYEDPKYSFCHSRILQLLKYRDFLSLEKFNPLFENHEEFA